MRRDSLTAFLEHIHPRSVPEISTRVSFTFCLGGLATAMFLVEILTGALLMLYYFPSIPNAYPSVQRVMYFAPYGFVFRNIHYWGGQAMVILVSYPYGSSFPDTVIFTPSTVELDNRRNSSRLGIYRGLYWVFAGLGRARPLGMDYREEPDRENTLCWRRICVSPLWAITCR